MKQRTGEAAQFAHRIEVGPQVVAIHQGNAFMDATSGSEFAPDAELGMFAGVDPVSPTGSRRSLSRACAWK